MPPVSKRSSRICWTASIAIRFASLVSTPRRAGRGTSRKTSPVSSADATPKRPAICRHRWKNSLIATRANIALCRPPRMNDDELKHLSPAQNAARIAFACGITALVVISAYLGILWLVGAHGYAARAAGYKPGSPTQPDCAREARLSPHWLKRTGFTFPYRPSLDIFVVHYRL